MQISRAFLGPFAAFLSSVPEVPSAVIDIEWELLYTEDI